VLIVTKHLGTGILTTAMKQRLLSEEFSKVAIDSMATLNSKAAELFHRFRTHACTDITGFGFLGHLLGMMRASETTAEILFEKIPFLPGVYDMGASGVIPGGTKSNHGFTKPFVSYSKDLSDLQQLLLNDAQTSGGLIISVELNNASEYIKLLRKNGVQAEIIGKVISKEEPFFIKVI
jgi:selenide,water dikinase